MVGGRTVAAAGTPAQIKIVDASPSDIADTYGFVDIFFEPLALPDGRSLPLRTPIARLTPNVSAGHESTVGAEDTVGDIFVPYYTIWQIVRKGKNFVLGAGLDRLGQNRSDADRAAQRRDRDRHPAPADREQRGADLELYGDAARNAVWTERHRCRIRTRARRPRRPRRRRPRRHRRTPLHRTRNARCFPPRLLEMSDRESEVMPVLIRMACALLACVLIATPASADFPPAR